MNIALTTWALFKSHVSPLLALPAAILSVVSRDSYGRDASGFALSLPLSEELHFLLIRSDFIEQLLWIAYGIVGDRDLALRVHVSVEPVDLFNLRCIPRGGGGCRARSRISRKIPLPAGFGRI